MTTEQASLGAFSLGEDSDPEPEPEEEPKSRNPSWWSWSHPIPEEVHKLSCPWCLTHPDEFNHRDNGIVGCPKCGAAIPTETDWYQNGEKITI